MTVATELAKGGQRLEYILCIEGVGWPADSAFSGAFQGTVIATADLDGDLATRLGCTVKTGLHVPESFSDELDPTTLVFTPGGADFVIDNESFWLDDVFNPRKKTEQSSKQYAATLQNDLSYASTTIDLLMSNPGGSVDWPDEGDVMWVGGREAVLLGTKAINGLGYRYSSSTRAYLGTPRGGWDPNNAWHGQHSFPADTVAYPWNPFWYNRRVVVLCHVPGEARTNCERLFNGRMTSYRRAGHGTQWMLGATALDFPGKRRERVRLPVVLREYSTPSGINEPASGEYVASRSRRVELSTDETSTDSLKDYAIYYLYQYRSVPGGAELAEKTASLPQAETKTQDTIYGDDDTVYLSQALCRIGDYYVRLVIKDEASGSGPAAFRADELALLSESAPDPNKPDEAKQLEGYPVTFLLDNILDDPASSWWTVNGSVRRNVIDVALILMTSCDSEWYRGDSAAGGTTTTVEFTAPGWTADEWIGYALHCVEGDNKGEARVIADNDADTITVDTPFSNAAGAGDEYQIRNTIYDVLPVGWGLQIHNSDIDVSSFESVRDRYLKNYETGNFILGDSGDVDYWELIVENIFRAHGVLAYIERGSGNLSARYVYALTTDSSIDTTIGITDDDLLPGSFSDVDTIPRPPVSRIEIYTRSREKPVEMEPSEYPVRITAGDAEISYDTVTPDTMEINALFNHPSSVGALAAMHTARLFDLYSPPYESTCSLDISNMLDVQAGSVLSVTSTRCGMVDPDTGGDDLSSVPCRVLSSQINIAPGGKMSVECRVQMIRATSSGNIAPACNIDSKGGADPEYFVVDTDAFVDNASDYSVTDFVLFAVGDLINHRAKDGSKTGGPYTIESFGTNEVSNPALANSARINVEEAIADAITAGDYLTFAPWSDDSTSNQETFSHYADATDEELGTGDAPKEYL